MIQLKKTLLTLVALLALTTGAWADDKKVVLKVDPITVAKGTEAEIEVKMDYTAEKTLVGLSFSLYLPDGILLKGFDTKEAQDAARASALKKAFDLNVTTGLWGNEEGAASWFSVKPQVDGGLQITLIDQDDKTPFVTTHAPVISVYIHAVADVSNVNGTIHGITLTDNENNSVEQGNIADVLIPFNATAQEPESTVALTRGTGEKINEWTLTNGMPAGNVTVSVDYYPQATADGAVTAATDAKATTDAPLVTVDATQLTGAAKMMYYASTESTAPAYNAEGWTDKVPTAEKFTEAGNVNVWYYPVGTDEGVGGATATYSDGDMNATALAVTLGAAPTYNVTFAKDNPEPDKWSADPNTGVKKGQTVTVTYSGDRKVIGVKAEKYVPRTLADATTADVGMVVCAAGHLHDAKTAVPDGCTAVGILGKVTGTGHGLILALKNATNQNWNTINGWTSASYAGTTLKLLPDGARGTNLTSYTTLGETTVSNWAVAQKSDYAAIFANLGSTKGDSQGRTFDGNVNAYITTGVGGTTISGDYWSATSSTDSQAWSFISDYWGRGNKQNSRTVRPVLGF